MLVAAGKVRSGQYGVSEDSRPTELLGSRRDVEGVQTLHDVRLARRVDFLCLRDDVQRAALRVDDRSAGNADLRDNIIRAARRDGQPPGSWCC